MYFEATLNKTCPIFINMYVVAMETYRFDTYRFSNYNDCKELNSIEGIHEWS
jgi:hypothetical protein